MVAGVFPWSSDRPKMLDSSIAPKRAQTSLESLVYAVYGYFTPSPLLLHLHAFPTLLSHT